MKTKIEMTFSKLLFALSIFVFSLLLSKTGFAQASYEVMCRNKAKEIAADTYKGCMTEQRQSQIEQIRKDYKEKLSNLKNHYDKKLKELSGSQAKATRPAAVVAESNQPEITLKKIDSGKTRQRTSGARLPQKKSTVATQVIDLTSPVDSQINTTDEPVQSESRVRSSDDNDAEVVELPSQE
jgi:hypothetical protein